jgi:hypothetical protein
MVEIRPEDMRPVLPDQQPWNQLLSLPPCLKIKATVLLKRIEGCTPAGQWNRHHRPVRGRPLQNGNWLPGSHPRHSAATVKIVAKHQPLLQPCGYHRGDRAE